MSAEELRRTVLYPCHERAGGKFVEFGGWEMPVQYSGLVDEHLAVRSAAGLFDVSHMGEVTVKGPKALEFLQHVTSNDVAKLFPGKAQYSCMLNENGGIVDDIIVYMLAENDYLLCINAANTEKDFSWLTKNNSFGAELENVSSEFAQIAIQGPKAFSILEKALGAEVGEFSRENVKPFCVVTKEFKLGGKSVPLLLARTGYTGEDGFEVFCPSEQGPDLWDLLMETGQPEGLKPAGLGARDTLRLEACYPLHGHELADDISALESGLGWVIKFKKGEFIGKASLVAQKKEGLKRKLVGLEVKDRGIIRHGTALHLPGGAKIGEVTSGTKPPTVGKAIGLGLVPVENSEIGTSLEAEVRGRRMAVEVIATPFYKLA